MKRIKQAAACLLIAVLLTGMFSVVNTEAAMTGPTNCRFVRWNSSSSKFTACRIGWDKGTDVSCYQIYLSRRDGTDIHYFTRSSSSSVIDITGLSSSQIYRARVRGVKTDSSGSVTAYSKWSNFAFITPLPTTRTFGLQNPNSRNVLITWNRIRGSNGYRVYMTTNPTGKWYPVSTTNSSPAKSVTVSKYRGSTLNTDTNYYVRVITRLEIGGRSKAVPSPSNYNLGYFWIYKTYY